MSRVLVRDLNPAVVAKLKARARKHGRSLQAELKRILEHAARSDTTTARALAARIRQRLAGRAHTNSVALLAEDR
ncbi:MAG: hypothetical protein HY725_05550 [Candidatus Rokubacteria bacterium]|nr:hypothetical protein [Candidatus Rokubacteria bacterium]